MSGRVGLVVGSAIAPEHVPAAAAAAESAGLDELWLAEDFFFGLIRDTKGRFHLFVQNNPVVNEEPLHFRQHLLPVRVVEVLDVRAQLVGGGWVTVAAIFSEHHTRAGRSTATYRSTSRKASAQRLVESAIRATRIPWSRKYSPTVTAV